MLDALVGNTDRHHENWGVAAVVEQDGNAFHLAPTFDHGSSLGREQTDERRRARLTTNDPRGNVEAYADRARSAFYDVGNEPKILTNQEVVTNLTKSFPQTAKFWAEKIAGVNSEAFQAIFARIAQDFVSEDAVRFALRMLRHNQRSIVEVALGA